MKRRSQPQEADLFTYAFSKNQNAQKESQAQLEAPPSQPEPVATASLKEAPAPRLQTASPSVTVEKTSSKPLATPKTGVKSPVQPAPTPSATPLAKTSPSVFAKTTPISPAPQPRPTPAAPAPAPAPTFTTPSLPTRHLHFARNLVVSIHDVSPLTLEVTQRIMAELRAVGVEKLALLVVPNHHCKGHFLDSPDFCLWLLDQVKAGHEIVVHGYHHRRDQRPGETLRQKLATQYYTAGEGEFYDISGADALRVISQARQEFRKIGIDPKGFVAPAWLLSDGADRALQRLGVSYTTRLGGLFDYTTGTRHRTQSLVWSTRSGWRRGLSLLWNAYLFRKLKSAPLLRISIHPPDIGHPSVWRQIKALSAKALKDRVATTFEDYLHLR